MLRAFTPHDSQERAHLERMLALCEVPGDPFARSHSTPGHFTASGFVLSPDGEALLLIHHRKLGLWLQPGGHVDADDADMLAASRREVHEEVGLQALALAYEGIFDLDVHDIPALGDEPPHAHFDVRFLFRAPTRELQVSAEVKDARWVPLDAAKDAGTDRSVTRAVQKMIDRASEEGS
ncbi:MAG: NUDIX hydrolase [Myxococcales bacterium]|jgi:8-oxo-dGTP pyrophosphatase MutT (NUDIX family)